MQRLIPAALALWCALAAPAFGFSGAVLYNVGGKLDKSFNESAFHGVTAVRTEKHMRIAEYEPQADADRVPMLRLAAASADIVVAVGFAYRDSLDLVAREYPKTRFAIIDEIVTLPNVQSIRFREQEGAFLAGVAAALASKSHTVGFVGGMDSALVRRFQAGYEQGARHADPRTRVISRMIGPGVEAFSDPVAGFLLAGEEIRAGADVLFAAAGSSGLGVYQQAADAGKLAIGVDSDQTYLFPGTMLTSVVKNVGAAVAHVLKTATDGGWNNDTKSFGLKEGGLSLAFGPHNAALISPEIIAATEAARLAIVEGRLRVEETPRTAAPPPTVRGDF